MRKFVLEMYWFFDCLPVIWSMIIKFHMSFLKQLQTQRPFLLIRCGKWRGGEEQLGRLVLREQGSEQLVRSSPGMGMMGCKSETLHSPAEINKLADLLCSKTSGSLNSLSSSLL